MQVENDKIIFNLRPDNILETSCVSNTTMTLEDGQECTRVSMEMLENQPTPLLCDLTNVVKMTRECREHFAGERHAQSFTKAALIVSKPISKIIGNFFLGLNKPINPTKLFTNKENGLKWLKS